MRPVERAIVPSRSSALTAPRATPPSRSRRERRERRRASRRRCRRGRRRDARRGGTPMARGAAAPFAAGPSRRQHVVVEPVADVHDLARCAPRRRDHRGEELRRRLLGAEVGGDQDRVDVEVHRLQRRLGLRRLVAGDDHLVPGGAQGREARAHVTVEVVGVEVLAQPVGIVGPPAGQLGVDVDARAQHLGRRRCAVGRGPPSPQHTEHRQGGDAQPVGPAGPDAALVDHCLADVEGDRRNSSHGTGR